MASRRAKFRCWLASPGLALFVRIRENVVTEDPHGPKPILGGRPKNARMRCPISPPPFRKRREPLLTAMYLSSIAVSMERPEHASKCSHLMQVDSARLA